MKFHFLLVLVFSILALECVNSELNEEPDIASTDTSNIEEEEASSGSGDQSLELEHSDNLANVTIESEETNETVVEKIPRHPIKKVTCLPNKGSNTTVSEFSDFICKDDEGKKSLLKIECVNTRQTLKENELFKKGVHDLTDCPHTPQKTMTIYSFR